VYSTATHCKDCSEYQPCQLAFSHFETLDPNRNKSPTA
jgi:hypothetical protein